MTSNLSSQQVKSIPHWGWLLRQLNGWLSKARCHNLWLPSAWCLLPGPAIGLGLNESPCTGSHSPLAYSWDLHWLLCSFTTLLKLELPYGSWFGCTAQVAKLINFESSTSGPPSGLGHLNHGAFQGCLGLPNVNHHFTDHFCVFQNGKPNQHFVVKMHWMGSPGSWFLISVYL